MLQNQVKNKAFTTDPEDVKCVNNLLRSFHTIFGTLGRL